MSKEEVIKIIQSLRPEIHKKYKANIIGLFGSYARGDETEKSDIDLLVDFEMEADLFDLCELGDYLEDQLSRKVDVISERGLREKIKPYVYQDLIRL